MKRGLATLSQVTKAIITGFKLIPLDTSTTPVDVADAKWDKPNNVNVAVDVASSSCKLRQLVIRRSPADIRSPLQLH